MKFFVTEKLGPKRSLTPEGFLLCEEVPIARTGIQLYAPQEIPNVTPGPDGIIRVQRTDEEVFRKETIQSCEGKPVVNNHPVVDPQNPEAWGINPSNFKELVVGFCINVRRGDAAQRNLLLGDLLIMDAGTIAAVQEDGKREISLGYGCDYIETGVGEAFQKNIIVNHIAIVEMARCGSVCSIGDGASEGAEKMSKTFWEKIRCTLGITDEAKAKAAFDALPAPLRASLAADAETMPESSTHVHLHTSGGQSGDRRFSDEDLEKRFKGYDERMEAFEKKHGEDHKSVMDAIGELSKKFPAATSAGDDAEEEKQIEGNLEVEAPPGTGDKARKATDSQYLDASFRETVAMAEIIAPGIHYPTYDSKAAPKKTFLDICGLRRKALQLGNNDAAINGMITIVRGGRELTADALTKMPCNEVRSTFFAVGAMKAADNKARNSGNSTASNGGNGGATQQTSRTIMEGVNKRNKEFWNKK